jgi:transcriptional regulator with PAS, ATPase and Fis domain
MHTGKSSADVGLFDNFVGLSPAFEDVLDLLHRFACSKAPMLICGETGTGKEQAALAAHYLSGRCERAFVPVNCGALPDTLLESELFGHSAGAFTGACQARQGLVREADGGTLFLDEVEALSGRGQGVLLRFLQDSAFRPLGEGRLRRADVRIIAASNVDLARLVETHEFRADLLFRLDVLPITLPPLRDRPDDIEPLVSHLLIKAASSEGDCPKRISYPALDALRAYSWPGNVRELEHVILRAHLLSSGECIDLDDLLKSSPALLPARLPEAPDRNWLREQKLLAVREVERRYVERALTLGNGNISEAARLCNMERATLSRMVKKYRCL